MQKRKTRSNNMLSQSRYVPINMFNLVTLLDNIKTHAHLLKIDLIDFLEI